MWKMNEKSKMMKKNNTFHDETIYNHEAETRSDQIKLGTQELIDTIYNMSRYITDTYKYFLLLQYSVHT